MSRLQPIVDEMTGLEDADDLMLKITEALTDIEIVPEPGNYYTFIYRAKTKHCACIENSNVLGYITRCASCSKHKTIVC